MSSFTVFIVGARKKHGWNQAELARRLDVGQQTVSGWERGSSRPRRADIANLARVLELDEDKLAAAAGYIVPTARPRVITLKLSDLSPDRLEQFTADLAHALYPGANVSRYGEQGHKQEGIDVIVDKAGKTLATFQCKRRQTFGPGEVKKTVECVIVTAPKHHIVLARPASPEARKEIRKYRKWTLWDPEDVSRIIRMDLPKDKAVRIIDAYFPGMREPFLGVPEPGPWLTPSEYFASSGGNIFSYDWRMVGREGLLKNVTLLAESDEMWLGAIIGRGGIGKTRLLRAVAGKVENPKYDVRFLGSSKEIKPEHFELLPVEDKLLVIIDDAHERTDIAEIIAGVRRVAAEAKILLSLRPYGITQLIYDLKRVQLHTTEIPTWEVEDLKYDDAVKLVNEVLGKDFGAGVTRRLAHISVDCPLIAVVGAELIKRGSLDPHRVEKDDNIRAEILRAFQDALVTAPLGGDPEHRRKILNTVSILQPVHIKDEEFQKALSKLTGFGFDEILPHINSLEDAGVLLRRGQSLRIVPDLLGDAILTDACYDSRSGMTKGFIESAREGLNGKPLQHVFTNASRVDWQIRQEASGYTSLVDSLWSGLEKEFKLGGIRARYNLVKLIQKVAYFQPDRALAIARLAIEDPAIELETTDDLLARIYPPDYKDVLHEISPILKNVAYNYDYLPQALDLLWKLAQGDKRETNPHPDHPIRVLKDLAGYETGKPPLFNEAIFEVCKKWLEQSEGELAHSPFEVLERLLATEGADNYSEGLTLNIRPYGVRAEVVRELRNKVVDLAIEEAKSSDLRRAIRAVEALDSGLDYPSGLYGREVGEKERDTWTPLFVDTMQKLKQLVSDVSLDPTIGIAIRRALQWHTDYSRTGTKKAAKEVVAAIPKDDAHQLSLLLFDGWGRLLFDRIANYGVAQKRQSEHFDQFAQKLVSDYDAQKLIGLLEQQLNAQEIAFGGQAHPGPMIWSLVKEKPEIGTAICRRVERDLESPLLAVLSVTLSRLMIDTPDKVIRLARELVAIQDTRIMVQVAHAFGWGRGERELLEGENELLRDFATDANPAVRSSALRAAQILAKSNRLGAASLLAEIDLSTAKGLVKDFFGTFGTHGEMQWEDLSQDQQDKIWAHLETCDSLEDYHVTDFLGVISKDNPAKVVELLLKRVELDEKQDQEKAKQKDPKPDDFRPVPYSWHGELHMRAHPQFVALLRRIRDWIAEKPRTTWQRVKMGSQIFKHVAGGYDEKVIGVLDEALTSGQPDQFYAVCAILHDLPKSIVWENVDFIVKVLHTAEQLGGDNLKNVSSALHSAIVLGGRSGTPGQPFPEDVEQRDRAAKIAQTLPYGSIEQKFYKSIERSAQESIRWHLESDEKLLDNRNWE